MTNDQLESIRAARLQLLDSPNPNDHAAAKALDWVLTAEPSGWRPIETAPRDGSIVLYWVAAVRYEGDEDTGLVHDVDVSAPDFGRWTGGDDGYHEPFSGIPGDGGAPTHWKSLPQPPEA